MKSGNLMIRAAAAAVFLVLLFPWARACAQNQQDQQKQLIDRVIAVVEDKALLQSEFDMEYRRLLMQMKKTSLPADEEKATKKELLDGLIADMLLAVHANKTGIQVSDQDVDRELENSIDESMKAAGGMDAFNQQLENAGMTMQQLRSMWREKIMSRQLIVSLMRKEVLGTVEVTEGEIRKYYTEHLDSLPKRPAAIDIAQILVLMKPKPEAQKAALEKIKGIEEKLKAGADFAETAKKYSEGPSAPYGGSLGYMKLEDFRNPRFEAAVRKLVVGETSGPVLTDFGYHLIKLEDVKGDEVKLRHILVKVAPDVEATRAIAEEIRQKAIDGADFGSLAAQYSDDPASKDKGGEVGEFAANNLPEYFLKAIRGVPVGGIGKLVEEDKGFRIVKVLGMTRERPYTFEEARDGIQDLIQQNKLQAKYKDYVAKLKKMYYVDVKVDI